MMPTLINDRAENVKEVKNASVLKAKEDFSSSCVHTFEFKAKQNCQGRKNNICFWHQKITRLFTFYPGGQFQSDSLLLLSAREVIFTSMFMSSGQKKKRYWHLQLVLKRKGQIWPNQWRRWGSFVTLHAIHALIDRVISSALKGWLKRNRKYALQWNYISNITQTSMDLMSKIWQKNGMCFWTDTTNLRLHVWYKYDEMTLAKFRASIRVLFVLSLNMAKNDLLKSYQPSWSSG